jgi:O-antigen ligase
MTAAVAPPASGRARWSLAVTRAAALAVLIGAVTSPPLAVLAAVFMLLGFALLPDALARLRRVLREPLGRAWLLFVATLLVAFAVGLARDPASALRGLWDWRHLLLLLVGLAVFDEVAARRRLALGFIVFAALAATASLVMLAQGIAYKDGHAPGVLLRNTVTQALTFAVGAYLALLLAATRQVAQPAARAASALAGLGLLAMLVFAQTGRSGSLALLVMAAVSALLLLRGRARVAALLALPLLAASVYAASPLLQQRFEQGLHEARNAAQLEEYTSMGIRVVIWQTTAELVRQRPWLGTGLGGFPAAYAAEIKTHYADGWKATPTADPHNQYLFLWAEAGALGLAGFLALLLGCLRQPAPAPYRAAGLALLAAWCTTSLFSSHFTTFNEGQLIAVLLGAMLASAPRPPSGSSAGADAAPTSIA